MRRFAYSLPAAVAALGSILVLACQSTDETASLEEDLSPLTKVEIPPEWHLDQIKSLYRDRARLVSDDGALYAASMRRTVDEAQAYVTELLDAHLRAFYLQRLREDGDAFPGDPDEARKYVAEIVAGHANMTPHEVTSDMERIDATLPSAGSSVAGVGEDGHETL